MVCSVWYARVLFECTSTFKPNKAEPSQIKLKTWHYPSLKNRSHLTLKKLQFHFRKSIIKSNFIPTSISNFFWSWYLFNSFEIKYLSIFLTLASDLIGFSVLDMICVVVSAAFSIVYWLLIFFWLILGYFFIWVLCQHSCVTIFLYRLSAIASSWISSDRDIIGRNNLQTNTQVMGLLIS